MREALEIMRRLLDGEKLTFDGDWYHTDRAKLYSPPISGLPIWMAAGGPKSAALAATMAEGIITSVRDPLTTIGRVIEPAAAAAAEAGRTIPTVAASRWTVRAETSDEAWQALGAWRGLRAPGRLEAIDPADLRRRADEMDREEVLSSYSVVSGPQDYVDVYRPLVTEIGADVVTVQTTALDQEATIAMLGASVLPELRSLDR
jgi:alkanesulfonate monooxygenase SsuD/methylene tetrahydromethanopterin reductase-like flavin-dependent oxidoreductase (luciferase family)